MPPRFITLVVVVFWLAAMSWLFLRDLWPALRPGDRVPFTIDLSREAEGRKSGTHWFVYYQGQRVGYANTTTRHLREDDTYELTTRAFFEKSKFVAFGVEARRIQTRYHVTQEGELRRVETEVEVAYGPKDAGQSVVLHVEGDVVDRLFTPRWSVRGSDISLPQMQAEPIRVRSHHSMLDPMQPWNRLYNVREKQRWRMTLFDPLADSLGSVLGKGPGARVLDAGVLEGTQEVPWDNKNVLCLVIEYHGDNWVARTFVRQSDGLVLRQEAVKNENTLQQERLMLERDPSR